MTSSYTPNKKIEKPAYNDYAATPTGWSGPVNTDWDIIDQAFGTTTTITVSTSATPPVYVLADTEYRSLAILITGAINADITVQIPSAIGGMWIIRNATTDGTGGPWNVYITSGGGGAYVPVARGYTSTIYSDGTNVRYADNRLPTAAGSDRQVQFNTNGVLGASSSFVYDSSGNMGIGTSSPNRKLDIEQASTDYQMRMGDAGANYYDIGRNTGNGLLTFYGSQAAASGYVFSTVNGERMRINNSGNVKIGTTAYDSAKLAVAVPQSSPQNIVEANFTGSGSLNATCYIASAEAGATEFDFFGGYLNGVKHASIDSTGNINLAGVANINTGAVTAGAALNVRNGGDVCVYAGNNTDNISFFCDTNAKLTVNGTVKSVSGGFQFPDNTIQTTAFPANGDGYQVLPSGLILQWGNYVIESHIGTTYNFKTPFSSACYSLIATPTLGETFNNGPYQLGVDVVSTSQFNVFNNNYFLLGFFWFAIGK